MKFISLFSGIGGFDLAFQHVGMECDSMCEIDGAAQAVLRRHFPTAKLYYDVKEIGEATHERGSIDLICGGFPCQDLSVAGKRAGLAGERSGLWFEFARIIDELEPRWFVIENVPGLLSSRKGRDFATIIQWLAERGYGVTWRILDAQYFGLAQRRRRVFIVGHLGDGRAAEVLFESEGVQGDTPACREEGQRLADSLTVGANQYSGFPGEPVEDVAVPNVAYTLRGGTSGGRSHGKPSGQDRGTLIASTLPARNRDGDFDLDGGLVGPLQAHSQEHGHAMTTQQAAESGQLISMALNARSTGRYDPTEETLIVAKTFQMRGGKGRGGKGYLGSEEKTFALSSSKQYLEQVGDPVAWETRFVRNGRGGPEGVCPPLKAQSGRSGKGDGAPMVGVRRLTPTECERLQGFPDGWTADQSDSSRYRQLGNAVAVPVVEWIGRRIMMAEEMIGGRDGRS